MKFYNQYENKPQIYNKSGSKIVDDYKVRLKENGEKCLIKNGKKDIYERIQMHKGEDIKSQITKLAPEERPKRMMSGNLEDFYKSVEDGDVYDLRDVPKSLVQAHQMQLDNQRKFMELPKELRSEFNNDYLQFQASVGSKKFEEKIAKFGIKKAQAVEQPTITTQTVKENVTATNTATEAKKEEVL